MLTTKKFIKEAEKLGFSFLQCTKDIVIYYENHQVAYISWHRRFYVGTTCWFRDHLPKELQEKLFDLLFEYARTPLEDREEPQKFYFKTKIKAGDFRRYLNFSERYNRIEIGSIDNTDEWQAQFTQKEIDDIKEKFKVTFSDFEQIPVEEDEEF